MTIVKIEGGNVNMSIMKPSSIFVDPQLYLEDFLGNKYVSAVKAGYDFLRENPIEVLRKMIGQKLDNIPDFQQADKYTFVKSYQKPINEDILTGYGIFKITEGKVLQIDWTGGHYQLPLGYHNPLIDSVITSARNIGIVDDTHNNTPGMAVKLLAKQLVKCANICEKNDYEKVIKDEDKLNRVTSVDTGTVAANTALKSILYRFLELYSEKIPVFIMQEGNYHGTDFLEQRLRGMWEWLFTNIIVEYAKPNDIGNLKDIFYKYKNSSKEKVAAVIMEPILMNNRAIYLNPEYIYNAKELCVEHDAILFLDEIQTSMWSPKIFMSNEYNGIADVLAIGKGLTNGYSPLAYSISKGFLDNQSQYSSISTNGNADMAALVGLVVLKFVENNSQHIESMGNYYFNELQRLWKKYPKKILEITGHRHLAGISIASEEMAKRFYEKCIQNGIFVRLQTYKEGESTIITKPPIIVDANDVDVVIERFDKVLANL